MDNCMYNRYELKHAPRLSDEHSIAVTLTSALAAVSYGTGGALDGRVYWSAKTELRPSGIDKVECDCEQVHVYRE